MGNLADFLRHWWRAVVSILSAAALAVFLVAWLGARQWQLAGFAALAVASVGVTLGLWRMLQASEGNLRNAEQKIATSEAEWEARADQLAAEIAALRAELESRWVNDDAVEWDSPELVGMPLGEPLDYVYKLILRGRKSFQPMHLRMVLSPAVITAEARFTEWTEQYDVPIEAVLTEDHKQLELRHGSAMAQGREVEVTLRLAAREVASTHHLRVLNVRRYRESGS